MKLRLPDVLGRHFHIPKEREMRDSIASLSPFERLFFVILLILFVGSSLFLFWRVSASSLVEVPSRGGSLTEGIVGSPRFINPLLAISDADRDLTALVYSGLLRATPEGNLETELAENYAISDDGLTYTFTIKDGATFHDGEPVTAEDIVFTIQKAQDVSLKSPRRASWDGVFVEEVNEKEVRFTLRQPYAPFLQNTTLGILPKHIWEGIDTENFSFSTFNSDPIGSGSYEVASIKRDRAGVPEHYTLKPFKNYTEGKPYLSRITLRFYPSEEEAFEAYRRKEIDSVSGISFERIETLGSRAEITTSPLPRVFGVFFNQNQADLFTNKEVRLALNRALSKEQIIEEVLSGYGTKIDGPFPPGVLEPKENEEEGSTAAEILEENGWERNENGTWQKGDDDSTLLSFSLSTSNTPELKHTAELLKKQWEDFGAQVDIKIFEPSDLSQKVIRPRRYDALLFGEVIGRDLDLFAFWHSSQRNDPGLNISLYANITTDKILENARTTFDRKELLALFKEFEAEIENDAPAVFLYSPDFIYILPSRIKGAKIGSIATPSERFLNVHEWHTQTEKIWRFLQ
ncbi:MAG: ABC transporter substrate-binding protein [Candidatus Paceibacterota bacterium]